MSAVERCDAIIRAIDDVLRVECIVRRFCDAPGVPTDADLVFVEGVGTCLPMFAVVGECEYVAADDALVTL